MNDLWLEFLDEKTKAHCGLCGNWGIIDNRNKNVETPSGFPVSIRTYCICPNGRAMKEGKWKI